MEGLDEVEVNPYANIALAQKEKVMEHIQRRHEAFLTRVDSQQLSLRASHLLRRQSFCLGGALLTTRDEEKIFEHFIVAGYPQEAEEELLQQTGPATRNDAPVLPSMPPQILFQYPCTTLSNPQVASFCFPEGVTPTYLAASHSSSDLHSLLYGSLTMLEDAQHSYLFLMNGGEAILYGVCVVQSELLSQSPTFFLDDPTGAKPSGPRSSLRPQIYAPRCYCLISRFPFFKLHFDVLYSLLAIERLKIFSDSSDMGSDKAKSASRTRSTTQLEDRETDRQPDSTLFISRDKERHSNGEVKNAAKATQPTENELHIPQMSDKLRELKLKRKELKKKVLNEGLAEKRPPPNPVPNSARRYDPTSELRLTPEERHHAMGRKMSINTGRLISESSLGRERNLLDVLRGIRKGYDEELPQLYHYKMENEVMKLLCSYRKTEVSIKELSFQLPGELRHYHFTLPEGNVDKLLADQCLISLFRFFFLADIVTIFQYCLLERKILFICKTLGVLSTIVMSLIPLLRPFVWQGPFIPILPQALEECVQSPVPFIIGVTDISAESREMISGECLIIDVDSYTWSYPSLVPPDLPNRKQLIAALEKYYFVLHPGSVPTPAPAPTPSPVVSPPSTPLERSPSSSPASPQRSPKHKSSEVPRRQTPLASSSPPPTLKEAKTASTSSWRNIFSSIKKPKSSPEKDRKDEKFETREKHSHSAANDASPPMIDRSEMPHKSRSISEMERSTDQPRITRSEPTLPKKRYSWFNPKANEIIRADEESIKAETESPSSRNSGTYESRSPPTQRQARAPTKPVVAPTHLLFPTKADEMELLAIAGTMKELTEHQKHFVDHVIQHSEWNTDWASPYAVEEVVKRFPRSEQDFMKLFFETQTFTVFTEKLVDIAWKSKLEQNRKLIEQVEEKIIREEVQKAAAFSVLQIYSSSEGKGGKGKNSKAAKAQDETKQELEETISCVDLRISALEKAKIMLKQEEKQMREEKRHLDNKRLLAPNSL